MDLNLLVALDALLREGSVARAAERLHLSAPAMSRTLSRIREAVGDPILVRAGRGLVATPRALEMRERVRALVEEATSVLSPTTPVSPKDFKRSFAVRANDSVTLGPALLRAIQRDAPGVRLRFLAEGDDEDVTALRDGAVDLDIGAQGPLGPEIRVQKLLETNFVLLVRRGGPHARARLTLDRFAAVEHVVASRRGRQRGVVDQLLAERGRERVVRVVVATLLEAAVFASQTDLVAIVPDVFARAVERFLNVRRVAVPLPLKPLTISQAWHPRFDADPVHAWVRQRARDVGVELGASRAARTR